MKKALPKKVTTLRKKQDRLNQKIAHLLLERLDISIEILKIKNKYKIPSIDPKREAKILKSISSEASKPEQKKYLKLIFKTLIKESVLLSKKSRAQ